MKGNPPKKRPPQSPTAPKEAKSAPARARLLLVEDHAPTCASVRKILESRDFSVKCAATVAEAWALVDKHTFDLLISDIGLPDGDGYLLMRELRDRHRMRGIALTGYGLEDDRRLSEEAGFSAHIVKPIKVGVLDEALARLGF